ncbi:MAG: glycosyltransferase, partial [Calditrichia bacterium]
LAYAYKLPVKEIPFIYKDTEYSTSKLSDEDRRKTFRKMFQYRAPFLEILRHLTYLRRDYHRFVEEYNELLNPPELKKNGYFEIPDKFKVSVGVMAYNEESNIRQCLTALEKQEITSGCIEEIFVVSSGCTDRTNEIVREMQEQNPRINLIVQKEREGKASAINLFLKNANGDICVLESADTLTRPDTIEKLIQPFFQKNIGITGSHPVPTNSNKNFTGFCVKKLWELHHLLASQSPKCGELIAFRNILKKIPSYTAVDEAVIESLILQQGLDLAYVPDAIVLNKGPENIQDFYKQRVRIAAGHKHLASTKNYKVSTYSSGKILKLLWKNTTKNPKSVFFTLGMMSLEAFARFSGSLNFYLRDKNPYVWDIAKTTKELHVADESN